MALRYVMAVQFRIGLEMSFSDDISVMLKPRVRSVVTFREKQSLYVWVGVIVGRLFLGVLQLVGVQYLCVFEFVEHFKVLLRWLVSHLHKKLNLLL